MNESPEHGGPTGYPGTNFAAHCPSTTYSVNGQPSDLLANCTDLITGIPACHAAGTKVLLSIGGVYDPSVGDDYAVSTVANGEAFATFLWYAFGPPDPTWTGPRPFGSSSVDGFDFDIELKFREWRPLVPHGLNLLPFEQSSALIHHITMAMLTFSSRSNAVDCHDQQVARLLWL